MAATTTAKALEVPSGTGVTIILKVLSVFLPFDVALTSKEIVVSELTSVGSPEITPADDKAKPAPEIFVALTSAKVTAVPSGSVAAIVK